MRGRRGVHWNPSRGHYQAYINRDGRHIFLGSFADLDEAARAHDAAARRFFGEFARLNFPEVPL